jgi:hypothetical protein
MLAKAKKQELIKLIQEIDMLLSPAIRDANEAAKKYSADSQSRLAFEVGYLNGIIKEALMHIDQVTK